MSKYIKNSVGYTKGYSGCSRCGDRWNWKEKHVVPCGGASGMFPLCEECYQECSPEERYHYCRELGKEWQQKWGRSIDDTDWDIVREHIGITVDEGSICQ